MADSLIGETVDDRWKIVERIGAGGMGVVYRAERIRLGKAVAIKFLDERAAQSKEAVARFDREARAISRVQHAHCVSILDFGVFKRRPYIAMEYVNGRRLNDEMGAAAMTPKRAIQIMRQILEGLRHAHAHGVIHRDLKPDNVMLTEVTGNDDFVKILDFGLARIISVEEKSISLQPMLAGTPSYMSPEQALGKKADHRADLYAAGVMLYGLCVGKKPFSHEDPVQVLRMHVNTQPVPPRRAAPEKNLSPQLERVILRAMAKDREQRFFHAQEFLDALLATPEARSSGGGRRRVGKRIERFVMALLAVVLVAAGAGGALFFLGRPVGWPFKTGAAKTSPPSVEPAKRAPPTKVEAPPPATPSVEPATPTPTTPTPTPSVEPAPPSAAAPAIPPSVPSASATPPAPSAATIAEPTPTEPPSTAKPATPEPASESAVDTPKPTEDPPDSKTRPDGLARETPPEVAQLVARNRLREAEQRLLALKDELPRAAWVHRDLGEIYFRQLWRKDAVAQWNQALRLDPDLARDERFGDELCAALAPAWDGAGERILVEHFGRNAVAPMGRCLLRARDFGRVRTSARVIEQVAGRGAVDRGLVALRTLELAAGCGDRRAAVQTLVALKDARAAAALPKWQRDSCVGPQVKDALATLKPAP